MSTIAWPETNSVVRETVVMSEDVMSASEFASLVREATLRAVRSGRVESAPAPRPKDEPILIGSGVRSVVEQAVTSAIKDLLGQHVLLSGPLRELTKRLNAVRADTSDIRELLRDVDAALSQSTAPKPKAVPAQATVATPTQTALVPVAKLLPVAIARPILEPDRRVGQKKCAKCNVVLDDENRSVRSASYCSSCLSYDRVDKTVEALSVEAAPAPVVTTVAAEVQAPTIAPEPTAADLEPIWVNGVKIQFNKRSQPGFIRLFRELVVDLKKGPVSGLAAYVKAQSYGFTGLRTTFLANIENHLGKLKKDDGMWSLPGWTP